MKRRSYHEPIVANQIMSGPGGKRAIPLPAGLVTQFSGFVGFTHATVRDATGATIIDRDEDFCPNGDSRRTRPDAPAVSPYSQECPTNPFTIGAVWGIQAGWSTPAGAPRWQYPPVYLSDGEYDATIRVNPLYVHLFDIPADQSSATVHLTVQSVAIQNSLARSGRPKAEMVRRSTAADQPPPQPAGSLPTAAPRVSNGPKPDLRSLPAWGIRTGGYGQPDGRDYLSFSATIWVAGKSPLVVDGFRRTGEDVMDAYQYFYDTAGNQVGYAPVGTMEWDSRPGHQHWHFTDFAQYRLLDERFRPAVDSGKEGFCLANTDAVDYTLPQANWQPDNTDLHTACGGQTALAVREVLELGSGDTYGQYLPGQSFDITDLPNGTYYIEVTANPDHRLFETDTTNNVSLRKVVLGGAPGTRTVDVPPYGSVSG